MEDQVVQTAVAMKAVAQLITFIKEPKLLQNQMTDQEWQAQQAKVAVLEHSLTLHFRTRHCSPVITTKFTAAENSSH